MKFRFTQSPKWFLNYVTDELDIPNKIMSWGKSHKEGSVVDLGRYIANLFESEGFTAWYELANNTTTLWIEVPENADTDLLILKYS